MKKYSYGRLVRMSWDRTTVILFRPFNLKKWIMLSIIVLLAGQVGGLNFNTSGNKNDLKKMFSQTQSGSEKISGRASEIAPPKQAIPDNLSTQGISSLPVINNPKKAILPLMIIGGILLLLIGLLLFLWMWVQANFSFVFIESVVKNDASLRAPFHKNKPQGNSYLMWNIFFSSAAILLLLGIIIPPVMTIVKSGMLTGKAAFDVGRIFLIISPYIAPLIVSIFALVLAAMIVVDFILPIMYRKKISILRAWPVFLRLFSKNFGEILLYFLVKLGLGILAILASIAIAIAGVICLLLIGGVSWLLGWLIYLIIPQAAKAGALIVLVMLGIGILIILAGLFTLLFLPIPVFFRVFSIYVLGSMDESLDIFEPNTPEMAAGEDVSRYKKSMRLVWFTVLSPLLLIIPMLVFTVISYPAGVKWPGMPNMKSVTSMPAIKQSIARKAIEPEDKLVTVYMRNGNSFRAEIERESKNNISFVIEGGTFILPRSDILRIERQPLGFPPNGRAPGQ